MIRTNRPRPLVGPAEELQSFSSQLREMFGFFRCIGVVPLPFFLAIVCTALTVVFNVLGMALLIQFLRGLIKGDFTTVSDRFGLLRHAKQLFPATLSDSSSYLALLLSTILLSLIMKNLLGYFSGLSMDQQGKIAARSARKLIISRCLSFGKQFYDGIAVSDISKVMIHGSEAITSRLDNFRKFFGQILLLLAYLSFMCWISWPLTLFLMVVFPVHHFFFGWLAQRVKESSRSLEISQLDFSARVFNVISAIGLVKSYAAEKEEIGRLTALSEEEIHLDHAIKKKELLISPLQDLSKVILLVLLAFYVARLSSEGGPAHVSSYLVFFVVAMRTIPLFGALAQFKIATARATHSFTTIRYVMNEEKKYYVSEGSEEFHGLREGVEIRNLNFGYVPSLPVLKNVSLYLKKGQMTAIVGATGAGKTTIAHLLMRFYDCPPSSIFFDGEDVRRFTLRSLMDRIAFVAQEPMFFNDTLRNNLCYGLNRNVSDDELRRVIGMAQLGRVVERLPAGLDSWMGERGVLLSGGEKQRVMIARALLKRADILIFDEATSAMDVKTEKRIQQAVEETIRGRTAIVIAHRLSTIVGADRILVLEDGEVVEQGTLGELLEKRGLFFEYWKAQDHIDKAGIKLNHAAAGRPPGVLAGSQILSDR